MSKVQHSLAVLSIAAASNDAHGIVDRVLNAKVWTHTGHHDGSANMSRLIFFPLVGSGAVAGASMLTGFKRLPCLESA